MSSNQNQEMWIWKYEPVSPSGTPPLEVDDDWLLLDDKSIEFPNNAAEPVMYDDHPTRAQVATKLLEELDEWIKEEPFSDWLEQKIDLPIFEELPVATENANQNKPIIYHPTAVKVQQQDNTQTLLQEFETVLGDVEACHQIIPATSSTLTPPHSPSPHKTCNVVDTQLLVTLQPVQTSLFPVNQTIYNVVAPAENSLYVNDAPRPQWDAENVPLNSLDGDVANELAVVDEYVRSHTKDIPPPSSPCTSSGGSCISTEDSTDDPDWNLESEKNSLRQSVYDSSKNRHKPYSRPSVEDKKVRKKEQNKNAATRYRQKKKQEIREIQGEERELTDYNEKLQNQVKDLQREIGYLKGLMRDLFKAKGLFK